MTETGGLSPEARLEWAVRLGRALRAEGIATGLMEAIAAGRAAALLDFDDPRDLYLAFRAVYLSDRHQEPAFDRVFWALWEGRRTGDPSASPVHLRTAGKTSRPLPRGPGDAAEEAGSGDGPGSRSDPVSADLEAGGEPEWQSSGAAWSPAERLARRSFGSLDESELRELDRALDRFLLRIATRRSRRLGPTGRKGRPDLRRSFRSSLRWEGEIFRLARRDRRIDRPRIVLLCDVSGSMERYSRFLVRFLLASGRSRDVETFAFSTHLVRLTPWLRRARPQEALEVLADRVPGWAGGTRIGASLTAFLERYGRTVLGRRTVVIILSDGLDQGEALPLERAMIGIRRRARKVVWLNPLLESPRYRPEARGMRAALPHVDAFASGHSLDALRKLPALIRL